MHDTNDPDQITPKERTQNQASSPWAEMNQRYDGHHANWVLQVSQQKVVILTAQLQAYCTKWQTGWRQYLSCQQSSQYLLNLRNSCFQIMKRARNRERLLSILDNVTAVSTRVTSLIRCNKFAEVESLLVRLPHTRAYQDNEEITRAKIALAWHNRDVQTVYKLIEVKP